jgi:hypothetical protein
MHGCSLFGRELVGEVAPGASGVVVGRHGFLLVMPKGFSVMPKGSSTIRCHHLLKKFWGWRGHQLPDGTVIWTAPNGKTYTTRPGSR